MGIRIHPPPRAPSIALPPSLPPAEGDEQRRGPVHNEVVQDQAGGVQLRDQTGPERAVVDPEALELLLVERIHHAVLRERGRRGSDVMWEV